MLDRIMRLREPAATLVALVVAANIVAAIVRVVLRQPELGLPGAVLSEGGAFMGLVSVLVVGLTVGACTLTRPPTRHAQLIAVVGAGLVSVGTLITAVFLVISLFAQGAALMSVLEAVGGITDVMLKIAACYVLWQLARRAPRPVRADASLSGTLDQAPDAPTTTPAEALERQPTTPRSQAAGARWNSAAEAAQGAGATWGIDGHGWVPAGEAVPALPAAPRVEGAVGDIAPEGPAAQASPDLWRR